MNNADRLRADRTRAAVIEAIRNTTRTENVAGLEPAKTATALTDDEEVLTELNRFVKENGIETFARAIYSPSGDGPVTPWLDSTSIRDYAVTLSIPIPGLKIDGRPVHRVGMFRFRDAGQFPLGGITTAHILDSMSIDAVGYDMNYVDFARANNEEYAREMWEYAKDCAETLTQLLSKPLFRKLMTTPSL